VRTTCPLPPGPRPDLTAITSAASRRCPAPQTRCKRRQRPASRHPAPRRCLTAPTGEA